MCLFLIEVFVPVAVFALGLWGAFRIPRLAALFTQNTLRFLLGASGVVAATLLYWWALGFGFFATYRSLAYSRRAENYPYPSWDVGLSFSLALDLALLLAVGCGFVGWQALRRHRSRAA